MPESEFLLQDEYVILKRSRHWGQFGRWFRRPVFLIILVLVLITTEHIWVTYLTWIGFLFGTDFFSTQRFILYLVGIALLLLAFSGFWMLEIYLYGSTTITVTNLRVIKGVTKWPYRNSISLRMMMIIDVRVSQTAIGRLLGYGRIVINPGDGVLDLEFMPNPDEMYRQILAHAKMIPSLNPNLGLVKP
jgi:hypothetical protein